MKKQLVGLMLLGLFATGQAFAAMSTFDTGDDGWSYYDRNQSYSNNGSLTWMSTGGNPGGYMRFDDKQSDHAAISAPTKFLGDWSNVFSIEYDFKLFEYNVSNPQFLPHTVILKNGNLTATWVGGNPTANNSWEHQTVLLSDTWNVTPGSTLDDILANVTEFIITIELVSDAHYDIEGIDNVNVSAVPIPAALWLFASGIVGFIAQAKRNRRTA